MNNIDDLMFELHLNWPDQPSWLFLWLSLDLDEIGPFDNNVFSLSGTLMIVWCLCLGGRVPALLLSQEREPPEGQQGLSEEHRGPQDPEQPGLRISGLGSGAQPCLQPSRSILASGSGMVKYLMYR